MGRGIWAAFAAMPLALSACDGARPTPIPAQSRTVQGVTLAVPGEGWQVLGESAKLLDPRVRVAAISPRGTVGVVLVDAPHGPLGFAGAGTEAEGTLGLAGAELAYRLRTSEHAAAFVHALAWSDAADAEAAAERDAFLEAVTVVEGQLEVESAETAGVGWRLAGGVYEDALARVRVRAAPGQRLLVGSELAQVAPDAYVGVAGQGAIAAIAAAPGAPTLAGAHEVPLADGTVMRLAKSGDGYDGLACQAGHCLSARVRAAGLPAASSVLGRLEWLPSEEASALADVLPSAPTARWAGPTASLRGGVFSDYGAGARWRAPAGWELAAGAAATAFHPRATAVARQRAWGLTSLLITTREAGALASFHEAARARAAALGLQSAHPCELGDGHEGMTSEGAADGLVYRLTSAVSGGVGIQLWTYGPSATMGEEREAVVALEQGLAFAPGLRAEDRAGGGFRSHRLGFELKPPVGWQLVERTADALPNGFAGRWSSGGRWLGVVAAPSRAEAVATVLGTDLARVLRGSVARPRAELAGRPAQHWSWQAPAEHGDLWVVEEGGIAYAVVAVGFDDTAARAAQSFALL